MSYDLAFWTDPRPERPEPQTVYKDLLDGLVVDGLGQFETRVALRALAEHFLGFAPPSDESGTAYWESPDGRSVFEFSWSPQYLLATARGQYTNEQMNNIIDVCVDLGGGRLYDPQTGERFDSE
jgi:hypothetical protein